MPFITPAAVADRSDYRVDVLSLANGWRYGARVCDYFDRTVEVDIVGEQSSLRAKDTPKTVELQRRNGEWGNWGLGGKD